MSLKARGAVILLVVAWLLMLPGTAVFAADEATGAAVEPADLVLLNRHVVTFRAAVPGAPPALRVEAIRERAANVAKAGGPLEVTTAPLPEGTAVLVDGTLLFRILDDDVSPALGESMESVTAGAVQNLRLAIAEYREIAKAKTMLPAVGLSLLATVALLVMLWLLRRAYRWTAARLGRFVAGKTASLSHEVGRRIVGPAEVVGLATLPLRVLAVVLAGLMSYQWAAFVLQQFPYTRPWGERLLANLLSALAKLGQDLLAVLPGLFFVALIFVAARFVTRLTNRFFNAVATGHVDLGWIDETTARPTGKLVNAVIWIFAIVAAYPYIPGSDSEAFKGIGVFMGLMLSIGASGIVNQAVSGLMLMYTRALRPGEFVQIGETEGVVESVGFLTTRVRTIRREMISIPNAVIAGNTTRNYSRLADQGGVFAATAVTIGYDTPWRQVAAMLRLAAERTDGVQRDPPPRILQTGLQDWYVEYQLLVNLSEPSERPVILDRLHANIQDVFNEHGVQIMSPHYNADPSGPKIVAKENWFEPPAKRQTGTGSGDDSPAGQG